VADRPRSAPRWTPVDGNTVKGWKRNDSIPGPYWQAFADARIATLEELAAAAEEKRRAAVPETARKPPDLWSSAPIRTRI
jgi:hypothetical protein